jgi:transcriptional regulator
MYIPKAFSCDIQSSIRAIKEIQLGAMTIFADDDFLVSNIPFIVKEDNDLITLEGHVAKTNDIWKFANKENKILVTFQGCSSYISPNYYPSKQKDHKAVPTYNYQAIHCYGNAKSHHSEEWILNHLTELTNKNENNKKNQWQISDAPIDYINGLVSNIVGIEIIVKKIDGILKMSQNHSKENRLGVIAGLLQSKKSKELNVARIMMAIEDGKITY